MEKEVALILLFLLPTMVLMAFSPIGRAIARRIGGEARVDRERDGELDDVRGRVEELQRELDEVHQRLDFAERVLGQARARGFLPGPDLGPDRPITPH